MQMLSMNLYNYLKVAKLFTFLLIYDYNNLYFKMLIFFLDLLLLILEDFAASTRRANCHSCFASTMVDGLTSSINY